MSFGKKNSDFITIIFHTFPPDIFYMLKEEVKGLFNFPARQEEKGDRSVQ